MNKTVLSSVAVVAVVAIAGGAWFMNRPADTPETISNVVEAQTFDVVEMVQGDPEAAVQIVEYASYTCPHCAAFHANQYQQIKENYIDTGKVSFVMREAYFDQPGLWASMVARCGGEMRYFGISDMLFESQQDWARAGDGEAIAAALRNIGKVAGLSDEALDQCMSDADNAQELMAWYRHNAEAVDLKGTPSFVINGEMYSNMSYEDFAAVLDEKLADAN